MMGPRKTHGSQQRGTKLPRLPQNKMESKIKSDKAADKRDEARLKRARKKSLVDVEVQRSLSKEYQQVLRSKTTAADLPGRIQVVSRTAQATCAKAPEDRSLEEVEKLRNFLCQELNCTFFQKFPVVVQRDLCRQLTVRALRRDQSVFRQGDPGEDFFVVLAGRVQVHVRVEASQSRSSGARGEAGGADGGGEGGTASGGGSGRAGGSDGGAGGKVSGGGGGSMEAGLGRVVKRLRRGDTFGEIALISDSARSGTVVATTDAEFLVLSKEKFLSVYYKMYGATLEATTSYLTALPCFAGCSKEMLNSVAPYFTVTKHRPGRVFLCDTTTRIHFIFTGEAVLCLPKDPSRIKRSVFRRKSGLMFNVNISEDAEDVVQFENEDETDVEVLDVNTGKLLNGNIEIAKLGEHDYFGHSSILPEFQRGWVVVATKPLKLYSIDTTIFMTRLVESVLWKMKSETEFKVMYLDQKYKTRRKNLAQTASKRPSLLPFFEKRIQRPSIFKEVRNSFDAIRASRKSVLTSLGERRGRGGGGMGGSAPSGARKSVVSGQNERRGQAASSFGGRWTRRS